MSSNPISAEVRARCKHMMIALTIGVASSFATARAVDVAPGGDIQAAINGASAGATINLLAGVHRVGNGLLVNKRLIISGAGRGNTFVEKTNSTGTDVAAINLTAGSCTVRNLTVEGQGRGGPGIMAVGTSGHTLSNVSANNCGTSANKRAGILLDRSNDNTLNSVTANNNSGVGISQKASSRNRLTGCIGDNNGLEGLTIDVGSNSCTVSGGRFNGNRGGVGGVGVDGVSGFSISGVTIDGSANGRSGICFQNNTGGSSGSVTNCTITNNGGFALERNNCNRALTVTRSGNNLTGNAKGGLDLVGCDDRVD